MFRVALHASKLSAHEDCELVKALMHVEWRHEQLLQYMESQTLGQGRELLDRFLPLPSAQPPDFSARC